MVDELEGGTRQGREEAIYRHAYAFGALDGYLAATGRATREDCEEWLYRLHRWSITDLGRTVDAPAIPADLPGRRAVIRPT